MALRRNLGHEVSFNRVHGKKSQILSEDHFDANNVFTKSVRRFNFSTHQITMTEYLKDDASDYVEVEFGTEKKVFRGMNSPHEAEKYVASLMS